MVQTPGVAGKRVEGDSSSAEQILFTHCLPEESIFQHAGASIRATSVRDPELLRFVSSQCSYELPLDMRRGTTAPTDAPRRLARVPAANGKIALVHTVHLPEDTCGRPNSFFSHVLIFAALPPMQALLTWGSTEWKENYSSRETKELDPLSREPAANVLNDQALTDFLANPTIPSDQNLATLICPKRLGDVKVRCSLLRLFLQGCVLTSRNEEFASRNRLYCLAEPGLTALLLYGALRLLPPDIVDDLTFSTYENSHRALREYKLARIVGTYVPQGKGGLNPDFAYTRGFGIDSFSMQCSPELTQSGSPALDGLVELAARGEYQRIDQAYEAGSQGNKTLDGFVEGLRLLELEEKLAGKVVTATDLLELRRSALGRTLLARYTETILPIVCDESLRNNALRQEFTDLLKQNLPKLKDRAIRSLKKDSDPEWKMHWDLIKSLIPTTSASTVFEELAGQAPTDLCALRLPLLRQWLDLARAGEQLPPERLFDLLSILSEKEIERLVSERFPISWQVNALFQAMHRPETAETAARRLRGADEVVFQGLCELLSRLGAPDQSTALAKLMPPDENGQQKLIKQLLASSHPVDAEVLHQMLERQGAYGRNWLKFWLAGDQLTVLLKRVTGKAAGSVWERFTGHIDKAMLLGDPMQKSLLDRLERALGQLDKGVPDTMQVCIAHWRRLRRHFENPKSLPENGYKDLQLACDRLKLPINDLLKEYFQKFILASEPGDQSTERFVFAFDGFYPAILRQGNYQDFKTGLINWIEVTSVCSRKNEQAVYVNEYLDRYTPFQYWDKLATEVPAICPLVARLKRERQNAEVPAQAISVPPPIPPDPTPRTVQQSRAIQRDPLREQKGKRFGWVDRLSALSWVHWVCALTILTLVVGVLALARMIVVGRNPSSPSSNRQEPKPDTTTDDKAAASQAVDDVAKKREAKQAEYDKPSLKLLEGRIHKAEQRMKTARAPGFGNLFSHEPAEISWLFNLNPAPKMTKVGRSNSDLEEMERKVRLYEIAVRIFEDWVEMEKDRTVSSIRALQTKLEKLAAPLRKKEVTVQEADAVEENVRELENEFRNEEKRLREEDRKELDRKEREVENKGKELDARRFQSASVSVKGLANAIDAFCKPDKKARLPLRDAMKRLQFALRMEVNREVARDIVEGLVKFIHEEDMNESARLDDVQANRDNQKRLVHFLKAQMPLWETIKVDAAKAIRMFCDTLESKLSESKTN